MEKRALVAITLTVAFLMVYPFILGKLGLVSPTSRTNQQISQQGQPAQPIPPIQLPQSPPRIATRPAKIVSIQQESITLAVSDATGGVSEIQLNRFKDFSNGGALRFFWGEELGAGWVQTAAGVVPKDSYQLERLSDQAVQAKATLTDGLEFSQVHRLRPNQPAWETTLTWVNPTKDAVLVEPVLWIGGEIPDLAHSQEARFVEVCALGQEGKFFRRAAQRVVPKETRLQGPLEWLGWKGKYFSLVMSPATGAEEAILTRTLSGEMQTGLRLPPREIPPQGEYREDLVFYAGPNNSEMLAQAHRGMERMVASGVMAGIGQVLLAILNWIYGLVRNYGLAIILLTILVNLFLFPLTLASLKSMRGLRKIQPKIQKLRELYKDNPQKMNKETLELYREHRVNPLGGCLPMILQMPIFIALYQTLVRSIELRGAQFLWIRDLSAPDSLWKLPWGIPVIGNTINLLPILMILAMWWQSRLSNQTVMASAPAGDPQRMMASMMPLMFGFIFYHLPAGLVLYWLTNTLLTTAYQLQWMKT